MLRIKIPQSENAVILNVNLKTESNLSGLYDDITNLVTDQTKAAINPSTDLEKRRFTTTTTNNINFLFWNGSSYVQLISPTDFTTSSDMVNDNYVASFYLGQIFTEPRDDRSTLLHNSYINGFQITSSLSSLYTYSNSNEYSDIHLPVSFLNSLTADTFYLYFKYSFYSAKSGKMHLFYNNSTLLVKEEDMYIKVLFNKKTYTYSMVNMSFKEITNTDYTNSINDGIDNVATSKPVYPEGTIFTTDGDYIDSV